MTTQSNPDEELDDALTFLVGAAVQCGQESTPANLELAKRYKQKVLDLIKERESDLLSRIKEEVISEDEPRDIDDEPYSFARKVGRNDLRFMQRLALGTIKAEIEGSTE